MGSELQASVAEELSSRFPDKTRLNEIAPLLEGEGSTVEQLVQTLAGLFLSVHATRGKEGASGASVLDEFEAGGVSAEEFEAAAASLPHLATPEARQAAFAALAGASGTLTVGALRPAAAVAAPASPSPPPPPSPPPAEPSPPAPAAAAAAAAPGAGPGAGEGGGSSPAKTPKKKAPLALDVEKVFFSSGSSPTNINPNAMALWKAKGMPATQIPKSPKFTEGGD
eukprot:tig00021432_g21203.t1